MGGRIVGALNQVGTVQANVAGWLCTILTLALGGWGAVTAIRGLAAGSKARTQQQKVAAKTAVALGCVFACMALCTGLFAKYEFWMARSTSRWAKWGRRVGAVDAIATPFLR
jgi:hypothetical protein